MIKTIKKSDFTRINLEKMQCNDTIIVLHDNFKSAESSATMCRMEIIRNPRSDISRYQAEIDKETFTVQITAIGKQN